MYRIQTTIKFFKNSSNSGRSGERAGLARAVPAPAGADGARRRLGQGRAGAARLGRLFSETGGSRPVEKDH